MDVSWQKTKDGLCLTVRDTGIGCSPDILNQIFDPFVVEDRVALQLLSQRLKSKNGGGITEDVCSLHVVPTQDRETRNPFRPNVEQT